MILLVPISPETPRPHRNQIWPGLIMVILLGVGYLETNSIVESDSQYIDNIYSLVHTSEKALQAGVPFDPTPHLRVRPLLRIAPSPSDWDVERLIYSNFIHGGLPHLLLNLIGIFAGAQICATFIPFLCTLSIFVLGGGLGMLASLLLSGYSSSFIPHIGASAGIFALMGTYYIYNLRFRTRYFCWFPSRNGFISLRTKTFFFVDVILLELVLSTAQLFPTKMDGVDHLAHVFGFLSGAALACFLRFAQRWPSLLQTRAEFILWTRLRRPPLIFDETHLGPPMKLLLVNPYNDLIKKEICRALYHRADKFTPPQLEKIFDFVSPTFIRTHSPAIGKAVKALLAKNRRLPVQWLGRLPYDSLIYIAKAMSPPKEEHLLIYELVMQYRQSLPRAQKNDQRLQALIDNLKKTLVSDNPSAENKSNALNSSTGHSNPEVHSKANEKRKRIRR